MPELVLPSTSTDPSADRADHLVGRRERYQRGPDVRRRGAFAEEVVREDARERGIRPDDPRGVVDGRDCSGSTVTVTIASSQLDGVISQIR
jgi:hypothetical protein